MVENHPFVVPVEMEGSFLGFLTGRNAVLNTPVEMEGSFLGVFADLPLHVVNENYFGVFLTGRHPLFSYANPSQSYLQSNH
jgi:hypothetical protein